MTPEDHARQSWQSAAMNAPLPSLEELRTRSDTFRRAISRRNGIEYAAGAFIVAAFAITAAIVPLAGMRIGAAMIVAATLYVMWQLRRRGSNLPFEADAGLTPVLLHQRAALVRQRDALRSVFGWYIAPFVPGLLVFFAAPIWADPPAMGSAAFYTVLRSGIGLVAIFGGVLWLNMRGALALQKRIDEIDAAIAG